MLVQITVDEKYAPGIQAMLAKLHTNPIQFGKAVLLLQHGAISDVLIEERLRVCDITTKTSK